MEDKTGEGRWEEIWREERTEDGRRKKKTRQAGNRTSDKLRVNYPG